jgi:hypothetical protein
VSILKGWIMPKRSNGFVEHAAMLQRRVNALEAEVKRLRAELVMERRCMISRLVNDVLSARPRLQQPHVMEREQEVTP